MKTPLLALSVALLPALPAQGLERAFPAQILAYASHAGGDATAAAGKSLGTVRLATPILAGLAEHGLLAEPLGEAAGEIQHALREAGFEPAQVRQLLRHPFAIGFGPPTLWGEHEELVPSLLLVVDAGQDAAGVAGIFEQGFGRIAQFLPEGVEGKRSRAGVEVRTLESRRMPGALAWAQAGGMVLAANSIGLLNDGLDALRGQRPSLAGSEAWKHSHGKPSGQTLLDFYANPAPMWQGLAPLWPYEFAEIAQALGIGPLNQISYRVSTSSLHKGKVGPGASSRQDFLMAMPLAADGALRALLAAPHDGAFARYCDETTMLYLGAHLDFEQGHAALAKVIQMLPAHVRRELDRELGRELNRELRHAGMDLGELGEVLHAIGPELAIAVSVPGVPALPIVTGFTRVDDAGEAERWLSKMFGQAGLQPREVEFEGARIHSASVVEGGIALSPSFAFHGNVVILSSDLRGVKGALKQAAHGQGGLAADAAFQALLAERPNFVAHARINEATDKLWGYVEQGVPFAMQMAGFDPGLGDIVPMREDAVAALDDYGFSIFVGPDGIRTVEQGPLGLADLLFGLHAFLDHVLGMEVPQGEEKPKRTTKPKKKIF